MMVSDKVEKGIKKKGWDDKYVRGNNVLERLPNDDLLVERRNTKG